jgi:DNA-binding HxlR family transcriptional regulator
MDNSSFCPRYLHAVELVGRRWTGSVLRALLAGPARYHELRETIPDISDRMLSERLRELEAEGIVTRSVIPATPVRVEYVLTEKGRALESAIVAISAWAEQWLPQPGEAKREDQEEKTDTVAS